MEKKHLKKIKAAPEYNSTREQNVLIEKIYSEVKVIGEGHGILKYEIDKINDKLEDHDKRFDKIESELTFVKAAVTEVGIEVKEVGTKVKEVDAKVKEVDGKVKEVDAKVKEVDTRLKEVDTRLKKVEQKVDTVTENHEQRLQKLEVR